MISNTSNMVQARATTHHFVFCATANTDVLRINQWVPTSNTVTTATLMISSVGRSAVPFLAKPNMEPKMRQAVVKSAARKNTHVTFTRKKVNRAPKKRCVVLLRKNAGAKEAVTTTGFL